MTLQIADGVRNASAAGSTPKRRVLRWPAAAGIVYVAAWLGGLLLGSSGPAVDAPGTEVVAHFANNRATETITSLLVHGVAGIALFAVAAALFRAAVRRGAGPALRRLTLGAGIVAATLSLVQALAGVVLAGPVAADGDAGPADTLFAQINRVDGLKMFALAALAGTGVILTQRLQLLPRWLGWVGLILALVLLPAGAGYLTLTTTLAPVAAPALVLLLVWIGGAGIAVARSTGAEWIRPVDVNRRSTAS